MLVWVWQQEKPSKMASLKDHFLQGTFKRCSWIDAIQIPMITTPTQIHQLTITRPPTILPDYLLKSHLLRILRTVNRWGLRLPKTEKTRSKQAQVATLTPILTLWSAAASTTRSSLSTVNSNHNLTRTEWTGDVQSPTTIVSYLIAIRDSTYIKSLQAALHKITLLINSKQRCFNRLNLNSRRYLANKSRKVRMEQLR